LKEKKQQPDNPQAMRAKTGAKHKMRAPLPPPDAFRCAHWLATMAFIRVEASHSGSIQSWIWAKWHQFTKYTLKHEKTKLFGTTIFSYGTSFAASAAVFGISTAVGAIVGTGGGPIGTVIGVGVGAGVGATAALVTFTAGVLANLLQNKHSRKEISDRLTNTNEDYEKALTAKKKNDEEDRSGHWYIVTENNETLDKIALRYEKSGITFEQIWNHERNKQVRDYCRKKTPGQITQSEVLLPEETKVWIPIKLGPDYLKSGMSEEITNLSYLVMNSLRDSVVHLRLAMKARQRMVDQGGGLTGGIRYVPGENETIDTLVANVKRRHPKLDITKESILNYEKNAPQSYWYRTLGNESFDEICELSNSKWYDLLEHESNQEVRDYFLSRDLNPAKPESRQARIGEDVARVFVPGLISDKARSTRYRIHEFNGRLSQVTQGKTNYLDPAKPVWIPGVGDLEINNCDDMINKCQPALEYFHHLNKARNYVLPCLNLCRMYLDVFEELTFYLNWARDEVEAAVLDYMQRGDHKNCYLSNEFIALENDHSRMTGTEPKPQWQQLQHSCIRIPLQQLKNPINQPKTYQVSGDDETIESIAAKVNVPAYAILAHNFSKGNIGKEKVKFNADARKWELVTPMIAKGMTLEIPPPNPLDTLVYTDLPSRVETVRLARNRDVDKSSAQFGAKPFARAMIGEVDIQELKSDLDKIIDEYNTILADNRQWHSDKWREAKSDKRRFYCFYGDLLHQHDMPDLATRFAHTWRNEDFKSTQAEKASLYTDAALTVLFGAVEGAAGKGLESIFMATGLDKSHLVFNGLSQAAFDPQGGLTKIIEGNVGQELARVGTKEGINQGWSKGEGVGKTVIQSLVFPALIGKTAGKAETNRITKDGILDFRRERMALATPRLNVGQSGSQEKALKEAAKEANELIPKISRHFLNAWNRWFYDLYPKVEALENNKSRPGKGLTGCRDSYRHLKSLYEYQHELDKVERYLLAALSFSLRVRCWESYLTQDAGEVWDNLEKTAGNWILNGDHSACSPKGHCYGPSPEDESKPVRPLLDRKPALPDKKGDHLKKKIVVKNEDLE
jgi:hypothetical protein